MIISEKVFKSLPLGSLPATKNFGTDFEWDGDDNYELLPNEEQFWDLIDNSSIFYDENYLIEWKDWEIIKILGNDKIHFCF